jgi:hypothetical protein
MTENEEITASLAIDSSPNEYSTGNDVGSTINQEEPIENKGRIENNTKITDNYYRNS